MVGGKVIGISRKDGEALLTVEDVITERTADNCAVRCIERQAGEIGIGDSVWWQSGKVYWTPKSRTETDVPLEKVGYSHAFTHAEPSE